MQVPQIEAAARGRNDAALGIVQIEFLVASTRREVGPAQV